MDASQRETRWDLQRFLVAVWNHRSLLLLAFDLAFIVLSFVIAYYLRFYLDWFTEAIPPPVDITPPPDPYHEVSVLTAGVWAFLLWKEHSYDGALHFSKPLAHQLRVLFVTGFYAVGLLMAVSFMYRYFLLSRVVYLLAMGSACVLLGCSRALLEVTARHLAARGIIAHRVLLVGWERHPPGLLDLLRKRSPGMEVIGRLTRDEHHGGQESEADSPRVLGRTTEIRSVFSRTPFDHVIMESNGVTEPGAAHPEAIIRVLNFCEEKNIPVYMVPGFLGVAVRGTEVGSIGGVPFIRLRDSSFHPLHLWTKRALDLLGSFVVLLLGLPLWVLIAMLVKLTSKGPIFFVQERAGLHGRPFRMYKFRSMVDGADDMLWDIIPRHEMTEPVFNIRRDPRVTPFGRILRRWSLDEVPQLINVLAGTMSLVGPRPERVELAEQYNDYQRRRLKAKPGITGYQQVMSRGEPSLAKRVGFDLHYLKYQNLFLDLTILARTIIVILRGHGMR